MHSETKLLTHFKECTILVLKICLKHGQLRNKGLILISQM